MLFFIIYKIGSLVALACPTMICYKIASILSGIKYTYSRTEQKEMVGNLKKIFPEKDLKTLKRYSKKIFENFSKYLVDFLKFEKLDLAYIKDNVEIVNRHYVDDGLKRGKGVITISAHLGNWELGGAIMGILGYPTNVIALDHKNKLVNRFFVNQRRINGEKVIPISVALRQCFCTLKNNELLAILGDKDFSKNGVVVKFFGCDTLLPKGPAVFSLKTGASIVPSFVIRTNEDKFKLIFEKPIQYSPSGNFDKDVVNLIELYSKVMETYIKNYPTQWYCFRKFYLEK